MPENIFDMSDADYLRNLAERLHFIPAIYEVDGGDSDRLGVIIENLEKEKV